MKTKLTTVMMSHLDDLYYATGNEKRVKIAFLKYLVWSHVSSAQIDPDQEYKTFIEKFGSQLGVKENKLSISKFMTENVSLLNEVTVTDPDIAKQVDELGVLINQIKQLKDQLKVLENNAKKIEDTIRPILDEMKDTEERILETQSTIAYIERRGGTKTNPKYKEAYLLSLTKVNATIRTILEEALAATTETSTFKSTISARPKEGIVKEGIAEFFGGLWSKLKGLVSRLKSRNSDLKKYNVILKKLSK